jgi:hypothetical protein
LAERGPARPVPRQAVLGPPEPGRCAAARMEVELALYPQAAVAAGPSSPARAPFPFPAPAARRVLPEAWGQRVALQPGAAAVLDVTARPKAAAHAVGRRQVAEKAVAAQWVSALAALPAALVAQVAEVRRLAAPDAPAGPPLVLPWGAASACRRDPAPPLPERRRAARSARVNWQTQTAKPRELSWQAARGEALS